MPDSGYISRRARGAVLLLALLGACSAPPERSAGADGSAAADSAVSVVDDAGRTVRLDRPARRVISLLPAATETLLELGGSDLLVARTEYDYDPRVAHLPSVGRGLTPSLEALAELRPDLVIAWEEAGAARVRPRLERIGISVFALRTQDTTDIFNLVRRLGHLTGRDAAADSLAGWMRAELESVRRSVAGLPRPTVLYVAGIDPPMTAGRGAFPTQLVGVAGGETVFPDLQAHWPQISPEEIVRRQPELIILPVDDNPAAAMARLRGSPGFRQLLAAGRTRVATVPVEIANRPGPSIVQSARLLRDGIHPSAGARGP